MVALSFFLAAAINKRYYIGTYFLMAAALHLPKVFQQIYRHLHSIICIQSSSKQDPNFIYGDDNDQNRQLPITYHISHNRILILYHRAYSLPSLPHRHLHPICTTSASKQDPNFIQSYHNYSQDRILVPTQGIRIYIHHSHCSSRQYCSSNITNIVHRAIS